MERIWQQERNKVEKGEPVTIYHVEFMSMLERCLNFSQTGNSKVLCKRLMDQTGFSLGIVQDGLPVVWPELQPLNSLWEGQFMIKRELWPVHPKTKYPLIASKCSQLFHYGEHHLR